MKTNILVLFLLILILSATGCKTKEEKIELSSMAISVTAAENRPVSFTNKQAAFWYTQSHINDHTEYTFFEGLTIAKEKIFSGYEILLDGEKLDNGVAIVEVFPHKMTRKHESGIIEEFWLFDHKNALKVLLSNVTEDQKIGMRLKGIDIESAEIENNTVYFKCSDHNYVIALNSIGKTRNEKGNNSISEIGYLITIGKDKEQAYALFKEYEHSNPSWEDKRESRMHSLIAKNYVHSDDDSLNLALRWLIMTTDQLVTQQQGYGIYAGLPWFSEYWGRDEFISMPGACLVLGEFEVARKILKSFAQYQQKDPASKFFGRVPNIVNPELVDYHTTDGTPRFIIQLQEYVRYSGDTSIIEDLYDNVRFSIEGSLKNWTDKKGYLIHEDNETWMDARRNYDKMPYSPRGTRANDIQALWFEQLMAGVYFAEYMNDSPNAQKWLSLAEKVKSNFEKDYTSNEYNFIADRLDKNDKAEYRLRPNQLFTFDLLNNSAIKQNALKVCWQELVYPWGVASLDRNDAFFHPFHLQWENYHKDEAYHNGTIWLWLNGIAMQRMIEFNQTATAYKLFRNMNEQVLKQGVVGGLAENMDAYPHKGQQWPKLTGTYLQAWSNAEQLRVWYQYFLGVRPDMINRNIILAPRIPLSINEMQSNIHIANGYIAFSYTRSKKQEFRYTFNNLSSVITIDLMPFEMVTLPVNEGNTLHVLIENDNLRVVLFEQGLNSKELYNTIYEKSAKRVQVKSDFSHMFKDIKFCSPLPLENHKVLNKKFSGSRGI